MHKHQTDTSSCIAWHKTKVTDSLSKHTHARANSSSDLAKNKKTQARARMGKQIDSNVSHAHAPWSILLFGLPQPHTLACQELLSCTQGPC